MNRKEQAIEQMERALSLSAFMNDEPINVMKRLQLHARIGELYKRSMSIRRMKKKDLQQKGSVRDKRFKSKMNESHNTKIIKTKQKNYEFT